MLDRLPQSKPCNIEAEQQLLGALMSNPDLLSNVADVVAKTDFYEPVHAELFDAIRRRIDADQVVTPVAMQGWAQTLPGMDQLGGVRYLVKLMHGAVSSGAARHYAGIVADMSRKRALMDVLSAGMDRIAGEDASEAIAADLEAALGAFEGTGEGSGPVSFMKAATTALEQAHEASQGNIPGIPTGIGALDRMLGPLQAGQLVLLAGRPSMGKSAVGLCIAMNVARAGQGVVIASLEMTPESLAQRAISERMSSRGRALSYSDMSIGNISDGQRAILGDAVRDVAELPIQVLPVAYRDINALTAGVKQAKKRMGNCGMVMVDYLQLLNSPSRSRYEQISDISIALKGLAMRLGVPVLALSQLSRAVENREDKRPQLSDLRESGQLEQDADAVLFCYRPAYYLERDRPEEGHEKLDEWQREMDAKKHRLDIIVAKQRQGRIGTAAVGFAPEYNRIWSLGGNQ